jgi:hypothetical protein
MMDFSHDIPFLSQQLQTVQQSQIFDIMSCNIQADRICIKSLIFFLKIKLENNNNNAKP